MINAGEWRVPNLRMQEECQRVVSQLCEAMNIPWVVTLPCSDPPISIMEGGGEVEFWQRTKFAVSP